MKRTKRFVEGKQMAKKRFWGIFTVVSIFVVIAGIFIWPFPIGDILPRDQDLIVIYNEVSTDGNGGSKTYIFPADAEETKKIRHILSKYSYHRTLRTFFPGKSNNIANEAGYNLIIYAPVDKTKEGISHIITGGSGEIIVNGKVYRTGYFGNQTANLMIEEIKQVLGQLNGET